VIGKRQAEAEKGLKVRKRSSTPFRSGSDKGKELTQKSSADS